MGVYSSQNAVIGRAFADTILAALKTVPGSALITSGKVRLSKDPSFNPSSDSSVVALEANEADFSGYPAGGVAVSLSAPLNFSLGCQAVLTSALFLAAAASPFVPNVVTGYWVDDGTNVVQGERFAGGVNFSLSAPGDFLELAVFFPERLLQPIS
jgi:hypothetical protein